VAKELISALFLEGLHVEKINETKFQKKNKEIQFLQVTQEEQSSRNL